MNLDCIPCFQRQALQAARFVTRDHRVHQEILGQVMCFLMERDWREPPPSLAMHVHRIVRQVTGETDPYRQVKRESNQLALGLYPRLRGMVEGAGSRQEMLHLALRLAIAGNIMDFGVSSKFDLEGTIERVLNARPGVDHMDALVSALTAGGTLLYITDNAGEVVMDRILLETVQACPNNASTDAAVRPFERILVAVKGQPMINDATREDALHAGLGGVTGVEFLELETWTRDESRETGKEYPIRRSDPEFRELMEDFDVVVAKGQGNYEALSQVPGIFFLLMAKCPVVARDLGVDTGDIIIKGT